jgi:hypothetical protein
MVFMAGSPCRNGDDPFCGRAGGASITCQVIAPLTRRYAARNRGQRFFSGQARHGRVKYLLRRLTGNTALPIRRASNPVKTSLARKIHSLPCMRCGKHDANQ